MRVQRYYPSFLLSSTLMFFTCCFLIGQESGARLKTSVNVTRITIGDVVVYSVSVQHPSSEKIAFPAVGSSLGDWVVRDVQYVPTKKSNSGELEDRLEIQLAIYKTGEFEIPALQVERIKNNGEKAVLVADPVKITVESVLTSKDQTLKELKAQAEVKPDYRPFLFFLAAFTSAVYLLYRLLRYVKRRRKAVVTEIKDTRSPEQIAREAIQLLLNRKLIEQSLFKQFYLELSEVIKRYLGQVLNIPSLERTTEEFTRDLKGTALLYADFQTIREFLIDCDLVKFAKYHPSQSETQQIVATSFQIIESVSLSEVSSKARLEVPV